MIGNREPWQYSITTWHGEYQSLFYIVRSNPSDETDWEVIETYLNRPDAERHLATLHRKERP